MSFIDYLSENYIWIGVIILLGAITIVGFVSDRSSKKRINNNEQSNLDNQINNNQNNQIMNNMAPQTNNMMPNNQNTNQGIDQNINTMQNNQNMALTNNNYINQNNIPTQQPDNQNYIPLSSQKPTFAPSFDESKYPNVNLSTINTNNAVTPDNIQTYNTWDNNNQINNNIQEPQPIIPETINNNSNNQVYNQNNNMIPNNQFINNNTNWQQNNQNIPNQTNNNQGFFNNPNNTQF